MTLKARLTDDLKSAMREKDSVRLETIRSIRAAITQKEVDSGTELGDPAILDIVRSLRKQRIEAIEQYTQGGRNDLAESEAREKELLESYLPAAPDAATVQSTVSAVIAELGATSMRDMGNVMKVAKERLDGVDGKLLSDVVKKTLS